MSEFSVIDLTQLPAPDVVEQLDYEQIVAAMLVDLQQRDPTFSALVESDPAYKILEVAAYRELLLRSRINDAARSVMVAYAKGPDLDNLAALFHVERQLIAEGDSDAVPPVPPVYEGDERLRQRIPLSLEGISTAGAVGAYVFHALAASGEVKDVSVTSPDPGDVVVTVLSIEGNGIPDTALLDLVVEQLNAETVRPLTDRVTVQAAEIITYTVDATLTFFSGPDTTLVTDQAREAVTHYVEKQHRLGFDITLSGLYAALHQPGVQNVVLQQPTADIVVDAHQAAFCENLSVTAGGIDE